MDPCGTGDRGKKPIVYSLPLLVYLEYPSLSTPIFRRDPEFPDPTSPPPACRGCRRRAVLAACIDPNGNSDIRRRLVVLILQSWSQNPALYERRPPGCSARARVRLSGTRPTI